MGKPTNYQPQLVKFTGFLVVHQQYYITTMGFL